MTTNDDIISKIEDSVIEGYQSESILGLFVGEDIGEIGVEKWVHKNLTDLPPAALTAAGFKPTDAKFDVGTFSDTVFTASERVLIDEKEWAQIVAYGVDEEGMRALGAKIGILASLFLFRGTDINGIAPGTPTNFFKNAGAGTLTSPSIITNATVKWDTYAHKISDLSTLIGALSAQGYNIPTTVIFYPKIATGNVIKIAAAGEMSAQEYLEALGVMGIVALPNDYMYTIAGATPTAALFDLYAIDLSQVKIGYTRRERARVVPHNGSDRVQALEAEVWFCPYIAPRYTGSTFVKGVSVIPAITQV